VFTDLMDAIDIIDKLDGVLFAIRKRGGVTISVARTPGGPTGSQLESVLRRYGVPIAGRSVNSQRISFVVSARQARWARYLLSRWQGHEPLPTPWKPR
jgi:hypothetical protein